MSGAEKAEFQNNVPAAISDAEAALALTNPGQIVSLLGRSAGPDAFVVMFATRGGTVGPLVLTRYVAEILRKTLEQQGF